MEERAPFLPPADESDVQQDTEQAAQVEQVAMQRLNECQQRLPQISRPAQRRAKKRRRAGMGGSDAGQRVQRARHAPVAGASVSTVVAEPMQIMRRAGIPEGVAQVCITCLHVLCCLLWMCSCCCCMPCVMLAAAQPARCAAACSSNIRSCPPADTLPKPPPHSMQRFAVCLGSKDQGDSAFSMNLLRSLDAVGATAAVSLVVELGLS